jgi:hypothetical protein
MPQFTLEINLGNDTMQTGYNVAQALKKITEQIEGIGYLLNPEMIGEGEPIRDMDNNEVGSWQVE